MTLRMVNLVAAALLLAPGCATNKGDDAYFGSSGKSASVSDAVAPRDSASASAPSAEPLPAPAPQPAPEPTEVTLAPQSVTDIHPAAEPRRIEVATNPDALRAEAMATLATLERSRWPQIRANAIEALLGVPDMLDAAASRGLVDENRGVRFVAEIALARAQRCELSHLVEPLLNDPSESVRAGAIAVLAVCKQTVDQQPLAAMLQSESTEVRANAYLALGIIGNRSAVGLVRGSVGRGLQLTDKIKVRVVEMQAAECLVLLGETEEIEPIRAALFAPMEQRELTALACQMVGRLRDERSQSRLRLLAEPGPQGYPLEMRVAALDALGRLGCEDPAILLAMLNPLVSTTDTLIRAQVAAALGATRSHAALNALGPMLTDPDQRVQVAAASAILSILNGG